MSTLRVCSAVRKAVAGARLVDPPGEARRNERDDDGDEIDGAFVPDDVCVVTVVDEA